MNNPEGLPGALHYLPPVCLWVLHGCAGGAVLQGQGFLSRDLNELLSNQSRTAPAFAVLASPVLWGGETEFGVDLRFRCELAPRVLPCLDDL